MTKKKPGIQAIATTAPDLPPVPGVNQYRIAGGASGCAGDAHPC
jgi:hypothetical protein